MSVKFTNPKKWDDVWFAGLDMEQKVMFIYLCEKCDIAGFLEINERLIKLQTGIENVSDNITSLSKSIIYRDGDVWVKKHLKHQKNLPINPRNGAHKAIVNSIREYIGKFPEIFEYLPVSDSETIKQMLPLNVEEESEEVGVGGPTPPPPPTSIGNSIGNSKEDGISIAGESKIARIYKYFVGEDNLIGQGITGGTRKILSEAIHVMEPEEWKHYCDARLNDEFKASPNKFFLEDGWRRYQDDVRAIEAEKKKDVARRKETEKRAALPDNEAPAEFKEFVKNFKRK